MAKSLLYRLFGIGKIPAPILSQLQNEGLILSDEGLPGSITYRDFRAPGRRSSWRRAGLVASLALTEARLLALSGASPVIDVPRTDDRLRAMRFSCEQSDLLCVVFDAGLFHADWSGTIEYRFRTPQAQHLLTLLQTETG